MIGNQYGKKDTKILFVSAEDFVADSWQHARVAVLRGVENGYSVVRGAQFGMLSISDSYGRIIGVKTVSESNAKTLLGNVTQGYGQTFYATYGDWFIGLCLFGAILLMCLALFNGRANKNLPHLELPELPRII